jgi:hypothetical protein
MGLGMSSVGCGGLKISNRTKYLVDLVTAPR